MRACKYLWLGKYVLNKSVKLKCNILIFIFLKKPWQSNLVSD